MVKNDGKHFYKEMLFEKVLLCNTLRNHSSFTIHHSPEKEGRR